MIEGLYNNAFNLYSVDVTGKNRYGSIETSLTLKYSNVPCYFTYLTGKEKYQYGKEQIIADHLLFCTPNRNIKTTDKVYVRGKWFDIEYIDNSNNMKHHLEVLLKGVEAPQVVGQSVTWGYNIPDLPTHPTSKALTWSNWTYVNTFTPARYSSLWGELELRDTECFVSNVVDTQTSGNKNIAFSYDDFDTCTHVGGRVIKYRSSNESFLQNNSIIDWTTYTVPIQISDRFIQVLVSIY